LLLSPFRPPRALGRSTNRSRVDHSTGTLIRTHEFLYPSRMPRADAFLTGAGFSRAVSSSMPLTADLGSVVARQLADRGFDTSLLRQLYHGDFEAWLTHLAEGRPWATEADNLRARAMFLDGARLVGEVIDSAQRRALQRAAWLSRLVSWWHDNGSTVISLNYDTLIEQTVEDLSLRSADHIVHYSSTYAVPISSASLRRSATLAGEEVDTFRLLKLHGSINWFYSGADAPHGETVYDGGLLKGRNAWRKLIAETKGLDLLVDKVPYVVPLTGTKSSFFNNETIRAQWEVASRFCRAAPRLVVMGYSLPESDQLMRLFIQESVRHQQITLVNLDPNTPKHFGRLLPEFDIDDTWVGSPNPIERFVDSLE